MLGRLTGLRTTRLLPAPVRDRDTSCHGRTVAALVQRRLRTPMRHYEIMIILDSNLEERTVQPSLDQFLTVVTGGGGKVDKVDIWGKRRLAYQIEKKSEGIYAVVDLTAEPGTVLELDRQLNLNEGVLRTKVMRPEHHHWKQSSQSLATGSNPDGSRRYPDHDRGQPRRRSGVAFYPGGAAGGAVPGGLDPEVPRQDHERVEGRRQPVPDVQRMAPGGGERRREPDAGDARHCLRAAAAAVV